MKDNPKEITLAKLEVLVMPNGEILCSGKQVGFVKDLGKYLSDFKNGITGEPMNEKKINKNIACPECGTILKVYTFVDEQGKIQEGAECLGCGYDELTK